MNYIDKRNEKIVEQMALLGKVKVDNFTSLIESTLKNLGEFRLLEVHYTTLDQNGNYKNNVTIYPFMVNINIGSDYKITITNVTDTKRLEIDIINSLPDGIKLITEDTLKNILSKAGYKDPLFDIYKLDEMDYPALNVFANKEPNLNHQNDVREESHVIIICSNYSLIRPDIVTCNILDELYLKNSLPHRTVRYCENKRSKIIDLSECMEEFNYMDRKFIRRKYEDGDKYYWLEVKFLELNDDLQKERGRI